MKYSLRALLAVVWFVGLVMLFARRLIPAFFEYVDTEVFFAAFLRPLAPLCWVVLGWAPYWSVKLSPHGDSEGSMVSGFLLGLALAIPVYVMAGTIVVEVSMIVCGNWKATTLYQAFKNKGEANGHHDEVGDGGVDSNGAGAGRQRHDSCSLGGPYG